MNNTFKKLASLFFMLLAVGYICAQNYKPTIRFAVIADRTGGEQKGIFEQTPRANLDIIARFYD